MSVHLFVNTSNAVPAANSSAVNPADLAEGRVGIFDIDSYGDGTLTLTSAYDAGTQPNSGTGTKFQFVQGGNSANNAIISPVFSASDVIEVTEVAGVAPTAQVTRITPTTGTGFASLKFTRSDGAPRPDEVISVEVKIDGKTVAQICDAFVEQINASAPEFITASDGTTHFDVTASLTYEGAVSNPDGVLSFHTASEGEAEDWTVAIQTAPVAGKGTYGSLKVLEEFAYGANYIDRIHLPITPPSYLVPGTSYMLTTVKIKNNNMTKNISHDPYIYLYIAVVEGGTDAIDLATFFKV